MIARLLKTCLDDRALVAQALFRATQGQGQRGQVRTTEIAKLDALEVVPDAFVWVQLGRITRQALQMQAFGRSTAQEIFDGLAAVDGRAVPDDEQLPADFA